MEQFLVNVFSFPTAVFTVLLGVVILYWLVSLTGMASPDMFDADLDGSDSTEGGAGALGGLMVTLGLSGVPITIVVSLLVLHAWLFSYFAVHFLLSLVPAGWLYLLLGAAVVLLAGAFAILATNWTIRPLRPLFRKAYRSNTSASLLGRKCVIRSSTVDDSFGEASAELDGASLILKVRGEPEKSLKRGDVAILIEYIKDQNAYRVIPEHEFTH